MTVSVPTVETTRHPHLAAVRVGNGTAVHAGHLSTLGTPDAPRYIPLCPVGSPRFPDDDSPAVAAHGAPVADPVTCRHCLSRYAHGVARIHTGQAADRRATIGRDPVATWNALYQAGAVQATHSPATRVRQARVSMALRTVYGLPLVAQDGRSVDREARLAASMDDRDVTTRTRLYLAAYAAQLDVPEYPESLECPGMDALDRAAVRFSAPDDAAQTAAGTRPAHGVMVCVPGFAGRWEVVSRTHGEQRRHPYAVRVRQEGHTFNASVPLDTVTVCPPDAPESTDGPRFGWQAVQTGSAQVADGVGEWSVYATEGGAYVGELWHNSHGEWSAYRRGYCATTHPTRGDALAAVGWLDTVTAGELRRTPGTVEQLPTGARGVRLVLADGTAFTVDHVTEGTGVHAAGCDVPWSALVTVTGYTTGGRLDLGASRPIRARHARASIGPDRTGPARAPSYTLTFRATDRFALTPPCGGCDAPAGQPCAPGCTADLD